MRRFEMADTRRTGVADALARTLSATLALLQGGSLSALHHPHAPALVPGALAPLILPRLGATVRRITDAGNADRHSTSRESRPAHMPGVHFDSAAAALALENEQLKAELRELKGKYHALAAEVAGRVAETDRLQHLALHDPLTQLPNRLLLMDRLDGALAQAQRDGTDVLVIFLDLDHFKAINDTMGHAAGDRVLREVAGRIAGCLRRTDTASRVGGDEFILVCETSDAAGDIADIRLRLTRAITAPIDVNGTPVTIGASLGFSSYPADGRQPADLIAKADQAMYGAKSRTKDPL